MMIIDGRSKAFMLRTRKSRTRKWRTVTNCLFSDLDSVTSEPVCCCINYIKIEGHIV